MYSYEELTPPEQQLWDAYPTGHSVDFRRGASEDAPEGGGDWGGERTVRASVVTALLLGGNPGQPGSVPALRLAGARINGVLDLSGAEIGHGMWFEECWFDQSVRLYGAATRTINIKASQLPGLNLTMARVEGRVALRRTVLNGTLELMNARLTGELMLTDGSSRTPVTGLSSPADSSWRADCSAVEPPCTAGCGSRAHTCPVACTWRVRGYEIPGRRAPRRPRGRERPGAVPGLHRRRNGQSEWCTDNGPADPRPGLRGSLIRMV